VAEHPSPELKAFIERVIVPTLVDRCLEDMAVCAATIGPNGRPLTERSLPVASSPWCNVTPMRPAGYARFSGDLQKDTASGSFTFRRTSTATTGKSRR